MGGEDGREVFVTTATIVDIFETVSKELDVYLRKKDEDLPRFGSVGLGFSWEMLTRLREQTVGLAKRYCRIALEHRDECVKFAPIILKFSSSNALDLLEFVSEL